MGDKSDNAAIPFPTGGKLPTYRRNDVANALARKALASMLQLTLDPVTHRRNMERLAGQLGNDITAEELHLFANAELPRIVAMMNGWDECSITGKINEPEDEAA